MEPDADFLAFKELLRQATADPALAADVERLVKAGAPTSERQALAATPPKRGHRWSDQVGSGSRSAPHYTEHAERPAEQPGGGGDGDGRYIACSDSPSVEAVALKNDALAAAAIVAAEVGVPRVSGIGRVPSTRPIVASL